MTNLTFNTSYTPRYKIGNWNTGVFWTLAFLSAVFFFAYFYSVYLNIDLSYKIEKELELAKNDAALYQQAEEKYITKLESMLGEGRESLGLVSAKNPVFVERFGSLARVQSFTQ